MTARRKGTPSDARLYLAIADNGPGPDGIVRGTGVGLANTRDRLLALYGDAAGFVSNGARTAGPSPSSNSLPVRSQLPMPDLRVLVADDEPPARQRVLDLLAREDGVDVVGEAGTGTEAAGLIRALRPDLVFLDVQMPGMTGLEVLREIGPEAMPVVVFVTAYDRHAVEAFELAAVDYLLKPYAADRFRQALGRARQAVGKAGDSGRRPRRAAPGAPGRGPPAPTYPARIAVESRGRVRYVPVADVDYVAAADAYVEVHAGDETFLVRDSMQDLEDRLDPALFVRIHRSTIVRLDRIESLLVGRQGDYAVRLHDGTRLAVARGRREDLEARLTGR